MLSSYSWHGFLRALFLLAIVWYAGVACFLYRKAIKEHLRRWLKQKPPATKGFWPLALGVLACALSIHDNTYAQTADANAGLSQANSYIRGLFDPVSQIMYAVGAIMALVGAIRVHYHWSHHSGQEDMTKSVGLWFGGCIFLVLAATVARSFFGI